MGVIGRLLERVFAVQPWEPEPDAEGREASCCQPVVRGVRMLNARQAPAPGSPERAAAGTPEGR